MLAPIDTLARPDNPPPVGEAVNTDGTLKDASEMEWFHSLSDETPLAPFAKRSHVGSPENVNAKKKNKKRRIVSSKGARTMLGVNHKPFSM